jgi:hypothetical protein
MGAVFQAVRGTKAEFGGIPGTLRVVFGDPPEGQEYVHTGFERSYLEDFLGVVFSVL